MNDYLRRLLTSLLLLCLGAAQAQNSEAPRHRRVLPRPYVYSQAQLKYTLNPNFVGTRYFSNWNDVPLLIDSDLKEDGVRYHAMQIPDFQRMQETARLYELDGFAFFPFMINVKTRPDFLMFAERTQVPGFTMLPLFGHGFVIERDTEQLLKSKTVLRLDGKVVLAGRSFTPETAAEIAKVKELYGDNFLFIIAAIARNIRDYDNENGAFPAEVLATIQDTVRQGLRLGDGFGWIDLCTSGTPIRRKFMAEGYDALVKTTAEVFAEPEFAGRKLLYCPAIVGHEHPSRTQANTSHDGTRTLRRSLATALKYQADLINIPEWDEQNENTSLRPTTCNSFSHLRIVRYLLRRERGEQDYALPGDDRAIPNLVLSIRKMVCLGEEIEVELLNIPDSEEDFAYTAELTLRNLAGDVLFRSGSLSFQANQLMEQRPVLPSERFPAERVILPELTVHYRGRTFTYTQGLPVLQLNTTWNWDLKWQKIPLRDILPTPDIDFQVSADDDPELVRVTARVASPVPLAFVQVLADSDPVACATRPEDDSVWRDNDDFRVIELMFQSVTRTSFSGTISLENATPEWRPTRHMRVKDNALVCNKHPIDYWFRGASCKIPAAEAENAVLVLDLPEIQVARIPVRDILARKNIILTGSGGACVRILRQLQMSKHPVNLRETTAAFETVVRPLRPHAVLELLLIDGQGRLFRSRPVVANAIPAQPTAEIIMYSETTGGPVALTVPEALVPDLSYRWDDAYGSLVRPGGDWPILSAVRGAFGNLATQRVGGGDQSSNGIPYAFPLPPGAGFTPELAPQPDGANALRFNGKNTFVAFAQGAVPRRAAFTMSFRINPDDVSTEQCLFTFHRNHFGSLHAVRIAPGGELQASYITARVEGDTLHSGLVLTPGVWNDVVIDYDQTRLAITVNGQAGKALPVAGPGLYENISAFGGWDQHWFKGLLRDFKISHARPRPAAKP